MTPPPRRRPRGPTDVDRAGRIARAAIDLVHERGPAALSHRAVAERADVPLGSTTYHFKDLTALLAAALDQIVEDYRTEIATWAVGLTEANLASRLAALLDEHSTPGVSRPRLLVEHELYLMAARSDVLRPISQRWNAILKDALTDRVGDLLGTACFAAYNGLALESLVTGESVDRERAEAVLASVRAPGADYGLPMRS